MLSHSEMQTLKATKETTIRLCNNPLITSEEKGWALFYLTKNYMDLGKIYALNKRMGGLILSRTPRSQQVPPDEPAIQPRP